MGILSSHSLEVTEKVLFFLSTGTTHHGWHGDWLIEASGLSSLLTDPKKVGHGMEIPGEEGWQQGMEIPE